VSLSNHERKIWLRILANQVKTWLRRLPCQPETLFLPTIKPILLSS
jgi:hypothetical protein